MDTSTIDAIRNVAPMISFDHKPYAESRSSASQSDLTRESLVNQQTSLPTAVQGQTAQVQDEKNAGVNLDQLRRAVEELQTTANLTNRQLEFRLEGDFERLQVKVVDRMKDEVIREIPPTRILEMADRLKTAMGMMVDTLV